ncbi:hypothetical protein Lepto7376_1484 [[Leptolyngbya] sp. PCC 7376]|nr:hypothetical protein Lepto7376_1484 [[Leptolyngbya] sp. PCC 7376]
MVVNMQSMPGMPQPRSGWRGNVDRLIGPGATSAELLVQFVPAVAMAIAAPLYAKSVSADFTGWQLGLIAFFALDFMGGTLTNATAAAKRWFHRPGQGWQQHLGFVAFHLCHIAVVAIAFRGIDWGFLISMSSYLLLATGVILASLLYLQRSIALGLFILALLGDCYLIAPMPGLEWFVPLLFLKLLVSHLPKENAYQPGDR